MEQDHWFITQISPNPWWDLKLLIQHMRLSMKFKQRTWSKKSSQKIIFQYIFVYGCSMIIMFADMCGCTLIICDTTITDMFNACLSGCLPKCQELGLVGSRSVDNAMFFGVFISHDFLRRSLLDSFGNQPDRHGLTNWPCDNLTKRLGRRKTIFEKIIHNLIWHWSAIFWISKYQFWKWLNGRCRN